METQNKPQFQNDKKNILILVLLATNLLSLSFVLLNRYKNTTIANTTQTPQTTPADNQTTTDPTASWHKVIFSYYNFELKIPTDWNISNNALTGEPMVLSGTETVVEDKTNYIYVTKNNDSDQMIGFDMDQGIPNGITYSGNSIEIDQILSTFEFTNPTSSVPNDWQTYTDSDFGLSFQYPPKWVVSKEGSSYIYLQSEKTSKELLDKNNSWTRVGDIIITKMSTDKLPNNINNLPLSIWINSQEVKKYGINPVQSYELGGLSGYRVTNCIEMCIGEIYLNNNDIVYKIDSGNSEYFTALTNKILLTFKFTN